MKIRPLQGIHPYILILLAVILAYWPVSFLVYGLKWDLIDVVLPFRYHFAECIRSGYFPFWNPYQQTGVPFYADLQAPVYYPELLYVSLFTGYGIFVMHFLFIAYTSLAGIGMYKLSFHFNHDRMASLMAGVAYALSGYLTAHGQHFFLFVSSAWIPFVLLYFIRFQKRPKPLDTLRAGLFTFLLLSGGYQALSIGMFYLLLILFAWFLWKAFTQQGYKAAFRVVRMNILFALIVIVLSLPLILSTMEILDHVARLEGGLELNDTLRFGQRLTSLVSFILPFSTLKYPGFFGSTDLSFLNHYFGLVPLLLFLPAMLKRRSALEYILLAFGLLMFLSSFKEIPLRELLFRYVPLMNLFKYAAILRLFAILAFILLAANYFSRISEKQEQELRKVLVSAGLVAVCLIFLLIYSGIRANLPGMEVLEGKILFQELLDSLTFHQHVFIQSVIQIIILLFLIILTLRQLKTGFRPRMFIILAMAELFLAVQFNSFYTVVGGNDSAYQMEKDLSLYLAGFPIPPNTPIGLNDEKHASFPPFWRNTYIYSKQVSFQSFSSFKLKSYDKLDWEYRALRDKVLKNPLVYFSDDILPLDSLEPTIRKAEIPSSILYLSAADYEGLKSFPAEVVPTATIEIRNFSPNRLEFEVNTPKPVFLSLLQSYYHGWEAYLDGEKVPVYRSNFNYRTIALPEGEHHVRFEYRNPLILATYISSNILFLLLVLFLSGYWLRKKFPGGRVHLLIPIGILGLVLGLLSRHLSQPGTEQSLADYYTESWNGKDPILTQEIRTLRGNQEFIPLYTFADEELGKKEATLAVRGKLRADSLSGALIVSEITGPGGSRGWHADKIDRWLERPGKWNEFVYFRNVYRLQEDESAKVFIWNKDQHNLDLDDIKVEAFPVP